MDERETKKRERATRDAPAAAGEEGLRVLLLGCKDGSGSHYYRIACAAGSRRVTAPTIRPALMVVVLCGTAASCSYWSTTSKLLIGSRPLWCRVLLQPAVACMLEEHVRSFFFFFCFLFLFLFFIFFFLFHLNHFLSPQMRLFFVFKSFIYACMFEAYVFPLYTCIIHATFGYICMLTSGGELVLFFLFPSFFSLLPFFSWFQFF